MDKKEREQILEKARAFFKTSIADSHASNTQKLSKLKAFNLIHLLFTISRRLLSVTNRRRV